MQQGAPANPVRGQIFAGPTRGDFGGIDGHVASMGTWQAESMPHSEKAHLAR